MNTEHENARLLHGVPLASDLKARVLSAAMASPSAARSAESTTSIARIGAALLLSVVLFAASGGVRASGRPPALMIGTFLGTACLAALALWALVARGKSMHGRSTIWLTSVAVTAPIALLAWKVIWSAQYEGALDRWPTRAGFRCLALSLAIAFPPFLALLAARRGTNPVHPGRAGMAVGVGLGLGAATMVDAWCAVGYVPHFLLGHILPVAVLAAGGTWIGRKILAP